MMEQDKREENKRMMFKAFLIKYGEIGLKGKNRYLFEDALIRQIRFSLNGAGEFDVTKEQGRIYVNVLSDYDYDEVIERLQRVFGIVAICPVVYCEDNTWENLTKVVGDYIDTVYPIKKLLPLRSNPGVRISAIRKNQWKSMRTWANNCLAVSRKHG